MITAQVHPYSTPSGGVSVQCCAPGHLTAGEARACGRARLERSGETRQEWLQADLMFDGEHRGMDDGRTAPMPPAPPRPALPGITPATAAQRSRAPMTSAAIRVA